MPITFIEDLLDLPQVYFFSSSVSYKGNNGRKCEGAKIESYKILMKKRNRLGTSLSIHW